MLTHMTTHVTNTDIIFLQDSQKCVSCGPSNWRPPVGSGTCPWKRSDLDHRTHGLLKYRAKSQGGLSMVPTFVKERLSQSGTESCTTCVEWVLACWGGS